MTRDDIIRMAEEASGGRQPDGWGVMLDHEQLERFAALVAAAEREWVGLTDEEKLTIVRETDNPVDALSATEAKLKEKNYG